MASRRTNGPVCGVDNCRSKSYEESEDGFLYCQNGHRQGGLLRGEDDEDNYAVGARDVTRKKKDVDEQAKKISQHFSGRRAFDLYLKCLQLILRHQVWFLVQEKGLPSELETVVFDLWALRISQLGNRIANGGEESESQSQKFNTLENGGDETTDNERGTLSTPKGRDKKLHSAPNLYDTLALCYIGTTTLRLPITLGDICAWVTDGKIAYRRAIRLLPLAMRDRLPASFHAILDPQTMLRHNIFYTTLTDIHIGFEKEHAILWPPLNAPLLLFRYIKDLALPLEIYDATLRLGDFLGHDFAFHWDGRPRLGIRHLPEAQLIGCLIVCVKLFYPFDKINRSPKSPSEPTAAFVNWQKWTECVKAADEQRVGNLGFTTDELTKLQEGDVFEMQPEQLDQYLKFYADTFLDDAKIQRTKDKDDFRHALYKIFPIDGNEGHRPILISDTLSHQQKLETVRAVHSSAENIEVVDSDQEESDTLRPGQKYPIWKNAGDLPKRARVFYEESAKLAGFSLDMLVMAVFFTEARVQKWRRAQRKGTRVSTRAKSN
ncbi:hypothetical protein GQ44DRAFT_740869 [Phaeosphaeriaceae sp. PMI808]|nr:hypothetical protein GQ44DRAFT_740869 [Phaeosphaeriaceae sp. PMI808]